MAVLAEPGRGRRALRWAVTVLVLAGCAATFVRVDAREIARTLSRADPLGTALALALDLSQVALRALTWTILLRPVGAFGYGRCLRLVARSGLATVVLGARAGDAFRAHALVDRDAVPVAAAVGVTVVEKTLSIATLVAIVLVAALAARGLPTWASHAVGSLAVVGLAAAAALLAGRRLGARVRWLESLSTALPREGPGRLALAAASVTVDWLAGIGADLLLLHALGVRVPAVAAVLLQISVNVAASVPGAPMQLGAFELGAIWVLRSLGADGARALSYALALHALELATAVLAVAAAEIHGLAARRS